jgi:hypothetical protein
VAAVRAGNVKIALEFVSEPLEFVVEPKLR